MVGNLDIYHTQVIGGGIPVAERRIAIARAQTPQQQRVEALGSSHLSGSRAIDAAIKNVQAVAKTTRLNIQINYVQGGRGRSFDINPDTGQVIRRRSTFSFPGVEISASDGHSAVSTYGRKLLWAPFIGKPLRGALLSAITDAESKLNQMQ